MLFVHEITVSVLVHECQSSSCVREVVKSVKSSEQVHIFHSMPWGLFHSSSSKLQIVGGRCVLVVEDPEDVEASGTLSSTSHDD